MNMLCTIPGKYGDLLWALPTVRELYMINSGNVGYDTDNDSEVTEVHVGIMPQYRSLLPLLNAQSYIDKAFVIENWICTGSHAGDQPWEAPIPMVGHPSRNQPLIDFIAGQQGIQLTKPIPFISVPSNINLLKPYVAYAFNGSMMELKDPFIQRVKEELKDILFIDVSALPWLNAATIISNSVAFIGCRSANYVLACGLGKKVFVYEPNTSRSINGLWGTTFSCPYADETEVTSVEVVKDEIQKLLKGDATCG
jgi:hypothetical protein